MARSPIVPILLVAVLPPVLIAFHIWRQDVALHGPSGGSGVIEGTDIDLSSKVTARITALDVREGQQVKKGQALASLDCTDPQLQLQAAEARLASAQARAAAADAQAAAADRAAGAARQTSAASAAQARALAAQRDLASKEAGRLDARKADIAPANLDKAHTSADALGFQAQAATAQAEAGGDQAKGATAQARAAHARADAADEGVKAAAADVARATLLVGECQITAPRDGVVETLPWEVGELVPAGQVLVRLVDLSTVKATFYLPDAELAAAKPGEDAKVVADAYGSRVFDGHVATVATAAEFTPRNIQTRTDRDRLVFPIEVDIPNPDRALRPGMPVQITLPGTGR